MLFDPTDPQLRRDPYPTYRKLREQSPVWRSPQGVVYFSRYQDCVDLMRSPSLSYDTTASPAYRAGLSDDPAERERQLTETKKNRSMLDMDPPEHTRLRSLINRAFTPQTVDAARPSIASYVDELLDAVDGATRFDAVEEFGSMLPVLVICDLMGAPAEDRDEFLDIGNQVARSVDPDVPLADKLAANLRLREYIAGLVELRRSSPGDDLMTRLIQAADDELVTEDELLINTGVLLVAGFETTTNLITNAVYRLLEHPEQRAIFVSDPDTDRTAIDEVLRFDPPVHAMRPRTIVADTEIGGASLAAGDAVVPLLAAANRDPDEFPDAERFDVTRAVNRHLSFGVGHHLCIGAALARAEARIAVRRLFERFPDLALSEDHEPEYRPNLQLRGFSKLMVECV